MKHYLFILVLLFCAFTSNAQTSDSLSYADNTLMFRGGKYYQFGNQLSTIELNNVIGDEAFKQYEKARKVRKAGIICTSVGGGLLLTSGILFASAANDNTSTGESIVAAIYWGPLTCVLGGVTAVGGIICLCSGNGKLRGIAKTYNLNNGRQITLAPATNGVGLALRF